MAYSTTEKTMRTMARAVPYQRVSRTRSGIGQLLVAGDELIPSQSLLVGLAISEPRHESDGRFGTVLVGLQHIPATANGMDQFLGSASIDLIPKVVDIDIDDVGEGVEVLIPHVFGDHGPGEYTAAMAHQIFEQRVLFQRQIDALPPPGDITG